MERRTELNTVYWISKRFDYESGEWSPLTHFFEDRDIYKAKNSFNGKSVWVVGYMKPIDLTNPQYAGENCGYLLVYDEEKKELFGIHPSKIETPTKSSGGLGSYE